MSIHEYVDIIVNNESIMRISALELSETLLVGYRVSRRMLEVLDFNTGLTLYHISYISIEALCNETVEIDVV